MFTQTELKQIRRHLGFSMKEFSELIGLNVNTYKKMESGERKPSQELQEKLDRFISKLSKKRDSKLEGKIDYLRVRFKTLDYKTIIDKVLKLYQKPFVKELRGRYSYDGFVSFGDINVYFSTSDSHMGTLVEFSGSGCRQFEWYMTNEQNRDWEIFLLDCFDYGTTFYDSFKAVEDFIKITRIDIALDEMYDPNGNYDLLKLKRKKERGLIKSKLKSFDYHDGLKGEESKGKSLYFGSKQSPLVLNFYEKDLEQAGKLGIPIELVHAEYGFKNRYEVRLLDDYDNQFVQKWLHEFDGFSLADKAVALINDKLHVYQIRDGLSLDDEWYALMGSYGSFKFEMQPKEYEPGVKEYRWLERSVIPTIKFIQELEQITQRYRLRQMIDDAVLSDEHQRTLDFLRDEAERRENYA